MFVHITAFYKKYNHTDELKERYAYSRGMLASKVHGTVFSIMNRCFHCGVNDRLSIHTCITSVSLCGQELCTVTFVYMKLQIS